MKAPAIPPLPEHLKRNDIVVNDVAVDGPHGPLKLRIYEPRNRSRAGLVWVHGGAFAFGDLDLPEAHHVSLALATEGVTVVSVDYQLAPVPDVFSAPKAHSGERVHFPVASKEVTAAFSWASENAALRVDRWSLGGASAGGNLAAGATLRLRDSRAALPESLVLLYPLLHAELPKFSADVAAAVSQLPQEEQHDPALASQISLNYVRDAAHLSNPYAFPGGHDLSGLPPVLIINSDRDQLRASGEAFAGELALAGVNVAQFKELHTKHGHLMDVTQPQSERSLNRIVHWLSTRELWAY